MVAATMPAKKGKKQWTCGVCACNCASHQVSIFCVTCSQWFHRTCEKSDENQFRQLGTMALDYWCSGCCHSDGAFCFRLVKLHVGKKWLGDTYAYPTDHLWKLWMHCEGLWREWHLVKNWGSFLANVNVSELTFTFGICYRPSVCHLLVTLLRP